jgi:hypothetical protein
MADSELKEILFKASELFPKNTRIESIRVAAQPKSAAYKGKKGLDTLIEFISQPTPRITNMEPVQLGKRSFHRVRELNER